MDFSKTKSKIPKHFAQPNHLWKVREERAFDHFNWIKIKSGRAVTSSHFVFTDTHTHSRKTND